MTIKSGLLLARKINIDRLYNIMDREEIDVLLASYPPNVYYISDVPCNYTAPNRLLYTVRKGAPIYCLIPRNESPILILTNAAAELAKKHSWIKDVRSYATGVYIVRLEGTKVKDYGKHAGEVLMSTLKELNPRSLAVEKQGIDFPLFKKMRNSLKDVELKEGDKVFMESRMIKTDEEIRRFREATRICCKAIKKVTESIARGISERDLVHLLKTTILGEGGDSWQQTTVAIGPKNGPDIYNQPSERTVTDGDVIRMDVGCVYNGYTSDNSRTAIFGKAPREAEKLYATLRESLELGMEAMKPGVKVSDVYKIIRGNVREKFDLDYTRGNVGHGVGVELYDAPELTLDNDKELRSGMTISVEVPYHKFGLGGFNIEESVLITEEGYELVSDLSRGLFRI